MYKKNMITYSSLYIVGTVLGQGMTFLSSVVFTRLMSQYEYGTYSTYYSIVSVLVVLVGCNLYVPLQNAYVDYGENIHSFRKAVLGLSILTFVVVSFVLVFLNITTINSIPLYMTVFALIHGYSFFLVNYRMYADNMEFNYKSKMIMLIAPPTLQFLLSWGAILIFSTHMVEARIVSSTFGVAICGVIGSYSVVQYKGKLIDIGYWSYSLKIAIPSIMMSISYMIMQQCDRVVITALVGAEETAVYSVIYYIGYGVSAVSGAGSAVLSAMIYRYIADKREREISPIQKYYLVFMSFVESFVLMVAPEVIMVISPSQYWDFRYVAPFVLGASLMVAYGLYTNIGMYYKKTGIISICVTISAVINVILNLIFVPRYGAVAACYTTVVAYFILLLTTKAVAMKYNNEVVSSKQILIFVIYSIFICILFSVTHEIVLLRYCLFSILNIVLAAILLKNKSVVL